jgi:Protein of unknown function (DUF3435)
MLTVLDLVGKISDAMQNLMMDHADIRTFLKHYLHRRVTVDTAAIVRGLDPQESVETAMSKRV